jgi:hypothetical protein
MLQPLSLLPPVALPVTLPVNVIVLAVAKLVAVEALPINPPGTVIAPVLGLIVALFATVLGIAPYTSFVPEVCEAYAAVALPLFKPTNGNSTELVLT